MLTARDAESVARKLGADFKEKSRRHKIAIIRVKGKEVGRFGIRRGSGDLAHDYIPQQIHVSRAEAEDIAGCKTLSRRLRANSEEETTLPQLRLRHITLSGLLSFSPYQVSGTIGVIGEVFNLSARRSRRLQR